MGDDLEFSIDLTPEEVKVPMSLERTVASLCDQAIGAMNVLRTSTAMYDSPIFRISVILEKKDWSKQ
jgi:hypothetical protein